MDYTIRKASAEDARLLAETRIRQLLDEGCVMKYDTQNEMIDFYRKKIADGSYVQYLMEKEGELVSTAGVLYQEYPPSISWRGASRGYISGVYTTPSYRGRGFATLLLKKIKEDARTRKLGNLWLMASKEGASVYREIGFDAERPGLDVYMEWFEE